MGLPDRTDGFQFGDFTLDKRAHCLSHNDRAILLTPKEFKTLLVLVESAGMAVEKEKLIREVWPDTFVSDGSLTRNISVLRKHLGEDSIATVSKYGYRFAYPVTELRPHSNGNLQLLNAAVDKPLPLTAVQEPQPVERMNRRHFRLGAAAVLALAIGGAVFASFHHWRRRQMLDDSDSTNRLAQKAYVRGRFDLERKNVPAFRQALRQFTYAVALDPHYARAYSGIAETYINLASNVPPRPAYAYAKAAALTAIHLDNNLAEAHRDLGWVLFCNEGDVRGAEQEYRRAIELDPTDAKTHHWYAQLLIAERRTNEALREAKAGLELDPLSLGSNYNYAFILIHAGKPEEAIQNLNNLLDREPNNEVIYGYLGRAYSGLHEYGRAAESFKRAMELSDLKFQYEGNWAYALAKNGDVAQARTIVNELEAKAKSGVWMPASTMTEAYIGLGDRDRAFYWFNRCVAERSCTLLEVNTEPFYSGLSGDPRFAQITAPLYKNRGAKLETAIIRK